MAKKKEVVKEKKPNGRPPDWTKERIEEEAEDLLKYANHPDTLIVGKYACLRGYQPSWLNYLAEKNDKFFEAYATAKKLVAYRREEGALKGDYNSTVFNRMAPLHDAELRAYLLEEKNKDKDDKTNQLKEALEMVRDSERKD